MTLAILQPAPRRAEMTGPPVKVDDLLIIDDHPLMCDALSLTLKMAFGLRHVRTEKTLAAAVEALRSGRRPDAVLLDLNLPDVRGVEGVVTLRRILPDTPITVISADLDGEMINALVAAGAAGYIAKSASREVLCASLTRMWAGETVLPQGLDLENPDPSKEEKRAELARKFATLTPQQMRILRLICAGKANKEISYELGIAEATVKTHVTAIMNKINIRRRTQAVLLANAARLFPAD